MPPALSALAAKVPPGAASNAAYHASPLAAVLAVFGWGVESEVVVPWELIACVCGAILLWDALRFGARQLGKRAAAKAGG